MAHLTRILAVLLVVLAMALSAVPASADPGTTGDNASVPTTPDLNVTWED